MHLQNLNTALLGLLALASTTEAARKPSNSVLLTSIQTLTLRDGQKTTHRRVSAIPQLNCVSGSGCKHYKVDVMRCKNAGSDYNDDNVQWTCVASLPEEFKLGSTDVICEGYENPDDPYILKGSCGVNYRLLLTDKGKEKYGEESFLQRSKEGGSAGLFTLVFLCVAGWILYSMYTAWAAGPDRRPGGGGGRGWGGGPGWGGGGAGGGDEPPPPYPGKRYDAQGAGWRPGFWSGLAGGAAAGYAAGNRGERIRPARQGGLFGNSDNGWGAGPSRATRSSSGTSSARHESTGFGSTSRR